MGPLLSRLDDTHPIALLGLDSAGKTTFMLQLKNGFVAHKSLPTNPTIGFNVDNGDILRRKVQTWDIGGQESTRKVWLSYVTAAHVIVYMVDVMDMDRWELSAQTLCKLLLDDFTTPKGEGGGKGLEDMPVLILYNKMDMVSEERANEMVGGVRTVFMRALNRLYKENPLLCMHEVRDLPCSVLKGFGATEIYTTVSYYLYMYCTSWWLSLLVPSSSLKPSSHTTLLMQFDEKTNYPLP